jgi:hypothetical protein
MKIPLKLSTILFVVLLSSCQKEYSMEGSERSFDKDAEQFFSNSGINDLTQKDAINDFVLELKDNSLWGKFYAIYPMVGGTAATTKWNLKDPRDLDSAYRLTFSGQPVFAATGVLFPTLSDYADTHFTDSTLNYKNSAISYYSRTENTIVGYDMGCTNGAWPYNQLTVYSDVAQPAYLSAWLGYIPNIPTLTSTGLFMLSSSNVNITLYRNGVNLGSSDDEPNPNFTGLSILIGTSRGGPSGQRECALATIGESLTDAQSLKFYQIVQNFQDNLGR